MNKKEYLERFLDAWEKCPNYTFCDLIDAVLDRQDKEFLAFISDDVLITELENFANAEKTVHTLEINGAFSAIKSIEARDELEAKSMAFDIIGDQLSDAGLEMEEFEVKTYRGKE